MEKSSTREQILEAALDLFAVNGYEATSISQLADAVGIRKASLYSHFANKQDILDTVVETVLKGYAMLTIRFLFALTGTIRNSQKIRPA